MNSRAERDFFRRGGARQAGGCHALPRGTEHSGLCDDERADVTRCRAGRSTAVFATTSGCSFRASSDTQFKKSSPTCGLLFFLERMTRLARLTRLPALRHAHGAPKSSAGEFLPLRGCSFRASSEDISPTHKKAARLADCFFSGADDEARTRYLHLGKVALYRMSYIRMLCGFVNVYIIHTDRTVVKHYFPFFTVGITRRASKMTSDIRTSQKKLSSSTEQKPSLFHFHLHCAVSVVPISAAGQSFFTFFST